MFRLCQMIQKKRIYMTDLDFLLCSLYLQIQFTGLSGTVRFDVTGQRKVEAFDVLNLNNDSFVKVNYI